MHDLSYKRTIILPFTTHIHEHGKKENIFHKKSPQDLRGDLLVWLFSASAATATLALSTASAFFTI